MVWHDNVSLTATEVSPLRIESTFHTQSDVMVVEADGRTASYDNGTLIINGPWSEYVNRPDSVDRNTAIAQQLGMRVLALETPGFGDDETRLSYSEMKKISHGDFQPVAERQWDALNALNIGDEKLRFSGYSMGANTTASLLAHAPKDVTAEQVILWEAASQRQSLKSLIGRFAAEQSTWSQYMKESPDWAVSPGPTAQTMAHMIARPRAHIGYPRGMTRGTIIEDIALAHRRGAIDEEQTEIVVASGTESHIAPENETKEFAKQIKQLGSLAVRRMIFRGESHGMIDSMPRVIAGYKKIIE